MAIRESADNNERSQKFDWGTKGDDYVEKVVHLATETATHKTDPSLIIFKRKHSCTDSFAAKI